MAEYLYIFGAGASVSSGVPTMNSFLDKAEDLVNQNSQLAEEFDFFFKTRGELQIAQSKSKIGIDNLEDIFGALEMALIIGRLRNYTEQDIQRAKDSLIYLIVKTIEKSTSFRIVQNELKSSEEYDHLIRHLKANELDFSCISFNYDLALDVAILSNDFNIDYCLNPIRNNKPSNYDIYSKQRINLLKPHGSINWKVRKEDRRITPHDLMDFIEYPRNKNNIEISKILEKQDENFQRVILPPLLGQQITSFHL